eukprot:3516006-Prymnesium_polylepis.1
MATVTWLIGALRSHTGQSFGQRCLFWPFFGPSPFSCIWEEAVLGGPRVPTTGAISSSVWHRLRPFFNVSR